MHSAEQRFVVVLQHPGRVDATVTVTAELVGGDSCGNVGTRVRAGWDGPSAILAGALSHFLIDDATTFGELRQTMHIVEDEVDAAEAVAILDRWRAESAADAAAFIAELPTDPTAADR